MEVTVAFGKEEEEERKISCRFLQTTDLGMLRCSGSNRITPPPLGLGKRGRDLEAQTGDPTSGWCKGSRWVPGGPLTHPGTLGQQESPALQPIRC